jgi:glutaredoxin
MKKRIKEVEEFGGANKLPIVIINGYHIGGFDEI